ncbi:carotenoid oxygenase family protein [Altericroceibacterium endophyticum]|uniref:Dioxygenase n=1 Tax=Altericroceibacterium endophyticum TaxID=1808508 RepID=A0A6I4T4G5_9SPHN|nr:carotenoid oxygenase family protein [Altericroceibacterium endophyticum]MXO65756.1 dioxygenase [Altericroceibacterium endophyticum]
MEPVRFSENALFKGWGQPMRTESTIEGLEVIQGEIPEALEGTLYRNGADWQYPSGRDDDIFIDGEGMFHMFRFEQGQVSYRSRWVTTERYKMQKDAKRALFGRYRNRYTNAPEARDANMGTANTTAMFHAGHLYALKEDDHPYELDPDTLETIGRTDMNGQITAQTFTAHPKVDPITNELLAFAYQAKGDGSKDICFYLFDKDGKKANEVWFEMPYPCCVHDFAVTDEWIVFPFFPLITDMDVVKAGGNYFQWRPEEETHIALVPRYGDASGIKWFKGPAASAGHMMNAVREGDKVHLDVCFYEGNCFPFFPAPDGAETPFVPPFLTRLTMDLTSNDGAIEKNRLLDVSCEMPRTDDRYQGRPYRHGFMIVYRSKDGSSSTGRFDFETGTLDTYSPGPGDTVQECQFVPRTPDSPEGDGWLLVPVARVSEGRSDLVILDAQNLAAGPVATVKLPVRVRSTFHGTWVPAETISSGKYPYELAEI